MKIELAKNEIIHFIGIGGIGMSGLSLIMKGKEFKVQGSDITLNKNIERLKKEKIKIFLGHKKQHIKNATIVVVSSAIKKIYETDICITRAGATTLAELSILNVPFIAVPLPNSKDNHQFENANFYLKNNACWILDQNLFEEKIERLIEEILSNKSNINEKMQNLSNLNFQNTWLNVNQKIVNILDEN